MRSVLLWAALGIAAPSAVLAQDIEGAASTMQTPVENVAHARAVSFVVMPIPIANPAIGNGLAVAALAIYKPAGSERPWTTGGGGLYTDTKSKGAAVFQKAYLGGDKYRVTAAGGVGVFNIDFFGIGSDAGANGRSIALEQNAGGGVAEVLVRVRPHFYAGLRYRLIKMDTTIKTSEIPLPLQLPDFELKSDVSQLGLSGEFDSRDSEYNPKRGAYATAQLMYASDALGSDFDYARLMVAVNGYRSMGDKAVLAWRGSICRSGDGAPFYDICNFGQNNDLRGYSTGQYRDHAMFAVQAEYRRKLFWRLGAVGFVGVGEVARDFGKLNTKDLLPAAGLGLRFEASRKYRVNASIDYAVGDGTSGLYFYVGEAF